MILLSKISVLIAASIFSLPIHASETTTSVPHETVEKDVIQYIKGSYIIAFKESSGVIDPPNTVLRRKVPFGETTSDQKKEDLAIKLGLKGQITAILEGSLNAIVVRNMDEQEAEKWRNDERVRYVEKDMLVKTEVLETPHVDMPE